MNKKFLLITVILAGMILVSLSGVLAKNEKEFVPPEEEGVYDVPGHPEMKVKVFVHREKPKKPSIPDEYCGKPDPDSDAVVDWAGWKLAGDRTYNLNLVSVPSTVGAGNLPTIADNASGEWEKAINNKIKLSRGANTTVSRASYDGKNIIAWGRANANALAITYVWYNSKTRSVVEVDTIMNLKYPWKWSGTSTCAWPNAYDAQAILTHELGHWFGLDDEYDTTYVNNTMYGYGYKGDAKADTLTTGDILGIQAIYK